MDDGFEPIRMTPHGGEQIETCAGAADDRLGHGEPRPAPLAAVRPRAKGAFSFAISWLHTMVPSVRPAVRAGVVNCNHDLLVGIPLREGVLDQVPHRDGNGIQVYSRP
jgi:hypothetical protein